MPSVRSRLAPVSRRIVKLWATSDRSAEGRTTDKTDGVRASPIDPQPRAALAFPLAPARYREPVAVLEARGIRKSVGSGRASAAGARRGGHSTVEADEVVAVLGRSGSGKSTLLHLLGGLDSPDAGHDRGRRRAADRRSSRALARTRLRHIGFVFQQFQLIEELSGVENVLLPTRLPGAPPGGARRAPQLIDELGLTAVADHLPHELSGGEQQRFAIARALVNEPELVLADEPTGSLDADNGAAVLELLRGLTGRAVVIVTHEPDAAAIADRVLHLARRSAVGRPSDQMSQLASARRFVQARHGSARPAPAPRC